MVTHAPRAALAFILLAAACLPASAQTVAVTPVAVQGGASPDGSLYILFGDVHVDPARRVTFTASLSSGRVGIFRTERGRVVMRLLSGDVAPGPGFGRFFTLFEAASNARGDLAFIANTVPGDRKALFVLSDGTLQRMATVGDPANTPGGETIADLDQVEILDSGEVYFGAPLDDQTGSAGRAILRAGPAGVRPAIAPGDRYMGFREVVETLQFEVNQEGEICALAIIGDPDLLQQEQTISEILLLSGGSLSTLASRNLSVSGGLEMVRHFAVTFDQVHITASGAAAFFASTTFSPLGAYLLNSAGGLFTNEQILAQGEPSPISPTDRVEDLGAFGLADDGTLVFHAVTRALPASGIFARRGGPLLSIARVGEPRPDGGGPWHGFFRIETNEEGAFTFTDFAFPVQVGIFLGGFVPPMDEAVEALSACIRTSGLSRDARMRLEAHLGAIRRSLDRGRTDSALRQLELLRGALDRLARSSLSEELAQRLYVKARDLEQALGDLPPN